MLIQFQEYLTFENIYVYGNFAVLPFWFLLILIPSSKITEICWLKFLKIIFVSVIYLRATFAPGCACPVRLFLVLFLGIKFLTNSVKNLWSDFVGNLSGTYYRGALRTCF